jgi:hypothetical protein
MHMYVITDDVSAEVLKKFKVEVDECGGTPVLQKRLLKYDKREQGTVTHHEFKRYYYKTWWSITPWFAYALVLTLSDVNENMALCVVCNASLCILCCSKTFQYYSSFH